MKKIILFVSHKKSQCGVYEFGKNITDVLIHSQKYLFIRIECSSLNELKSAIDEHSPDAIIYNYYPSVLPWLTTQFGSIHWKNNIASIHIPQIGIIHEITQHIADAATNYKMRFFLRRTSNLINSLFDFYIAPDPTLLLTNRIVFKTGRLLPFYQNLFLVSTNPIIGSFGFATPKKGFDKVVELVQHEYDEAVIRFNIPAADYGDRDGYNARALAEKCKLLIYKPGIQLIVTHDFFDNTSLLDFLAQNTVNIFLYEHDESSSRGLSSAVDNAIAVQRPVAVSEGSMFRHVIDIEPSVCVTKNTLKTIIQNGFAPLHKYSNEWNSENLLWDYERILNSIFSKQIQSKPKDNFIRTLQSKFKRLFSTPEINFTLLNDSRKKSLDDMQLSCTAKYHPIKIPTGLHLNRILDNKGRELYKPAIDKLEELLPNTMSRKIAEANVQQAFVFDTVHRYISQYQNPKLLCVGSYEDTASMSLKKGGFKVEEIDPMINYYLQEYVSKPTTVKNSYNIIFSTSVIEHDPDDESFVKCIAELLAPGGVAIITCDFKDGWKCNEPKPEGNERLYTQHDLRFRLLPLMSDCYLVDEPQWDCTNPDFLYLGKYRYTFATLVVKKQLTTDNNSWLLNND